MTVNRYVKCVCLVGALLLAVSCSSKKKAEDSSAVAAGDVSKDANVGAKDMAFDSMGSDSGNIPGLNTINFGYDDASLSPSARKTLAENAEWIKSHSNVTVQVEGHCDDRGSVEYNLALGERRAKSVKNYLVSLGIDAKRLTVISYGKEKPIAHGTSDADFAKNRRANFVPIAQ